ncbi:hypothetical protein SISNIDRAFT_471689 [Sistotremastrum niveocremeum HHB9708]|uniref:Uncharacterized protein n=1 Tax=Sistotremastrum niveocremeum HHB9708 TaxID=1314777 RepID=A0A164MC41_9AGAM|nr:hypothetical protein SISNIDRAFT_471689 [Sistotremastrum niveocremeum HHB9708]
MRFAWTPDQQPSEFTCDQAAELEKKLFAVEEFLIQEYLIQRLDHSSSESFGSVVPNLVEPSNVETGAPWWPVALQMWRSVGRQLGRMWRWSRKAENLDTSGDVELALPHLAQF